jgi:hypothetical protein
VLPREYFKSLEVEEGGVGAGTRIHLKVRVLGTTIEFRHLVNEAEPGRVLIESDADSGSVTTFTVNPLDSGVASMLTITTEFTTQRRGILGRIERFLTIRTLRRIYRKELSLIGKSLRKRETVYSGVVAISLSEAFFCQAHPDLRVAHAARLTTQT